MIRVHVLDGLTDGIVTEDQWPAIESYLSDLEKSKRKASLDEQRTALQEALSQSSGHSISFVLIIVTIDMRSYEGLTRRLFAENESVRSYRTLIALDRVKADTAIVIA